MACPKVVVRLDRCHCRQLHSPAHHLPHPSHPRVPTPLRQFHVHSQLSTDGVFRALTDDRSSMPWIEALRSHENDSQRATTPQTGKAKPGRNLTPKKMSDSFHRVVCFMFLLMRSIGRADSRLMRSFRSFLWRKTRGFRIPTSTLQDTYGMTRLGEQRSSTRAESA